MPLIDHLGLPLDTIRQWNSFLSSWAVMIAGGLNAYMPEGYFAAPNVQLRIDINLAGVREPDSEWPDEFDPPRRWQPGLPTASVPFALAIDEIEVRLFDSGSALVGVIELVSPTNKGSPGDPGRLQRQVPDLLEVGRRRPRDRRRHQAVCRPARRVDGTDQPRLAGKPIPVADGDFLSPQP